MANECEVKDQERNRLNAHNLQLQNALEDKAEHVQLLQQKFKDDS